MLCGVRKLVRVAEAFEKDELLARAAFVDRLLHQLHHDVDVEVDS